MARVLLVKKVCVYCGSSPGKHPQFLEAARALGREFLTRDITLVYGGASVGIMGEIADAVLAGGGDVVGVIPRSLAEKEVSHSGLTELHLVESMHERKSLMADLAEGFIALPGGLGTIEELFEVLTWSQLGFHRKPCGLLNVGAYYDHLLAFIEHAVAQQFVKPVHRDMLLAADAPAPLLDAMADYTPPAVDKWIGRAQN